MLLLKVLGENLFHAFFLVSGVIGNPRCSLACGHIHHSLQSLPLLSHGITPVSLCLYPNFPSLIRAPAILD